MDSVPSQRSGDHDGITLPSPSMSTKGFSKLPAEICTMIFGQLPVKDRFSAMRVSRAWHLHMKEERKVWELFDIEGLKISDAEVPVKAFESAFKLSRGGIKHVNLVPSSQYRGYGHYLLSCISGNRPRTRSAHGLAQDSAVSSWAKAKQNIKSLTCGFGSDWIKSDLWQLLTDMTSLKELQVLRFSGDEFMDQCTGKSLPKTLQKLGIRALEGPIHMYWQLRGSIDELEIDQGLGQRIRMNCFVLLAETLTSLTITNGTIVSKAHSLDANKDLSKLVNWDADMPFSVLVNLRSLALDRCMIHTTIDLPLSLRSFTVKRTWHIGKFAGKDVTIGKDWGTFKKATGSWVRVGDGGALGFEDWEVVLLELH